MTRRPPRHPQRDSGLDVVIAYVEFLHLSLLWTLFGQLPIVFAMELKFGQRELILENEPTYDRVHTVPSRCFHLHGGRHLQKLQLNKQSL